MTEEVKADVVVLLGAGASVDAGLPTTDEMIDRLLEDFGQQAENERINEPMRPFLGLLEFIVHGLRQEAAVRDDRENRAGVDVETMFEAIETLANRTQLSIAPFIASWHPLVSEAERSVAAARHYDSPQRRLSKLLADAILNGAGRLGSRFRIGRASCRERGQMLVRDGAGENK